MKIIKEPNCLVECPVCHCQFEFDETDVYEATGGMRHRVGAINPHKAVRCPICEKSIPVWGTDRKEN
jgi:hypothetical protein